MNNNRKQACVTQSEQKGKEEQTYSTWIYVCDDLGAGLSALHCTSAGLRRINYNMVSIKFKYILIYIRAITLTTC